MNDAAVGQFNHTIFYPEPFDFHYPSETIHNNKSNRVKLYATVGEYEAGTFVVHSTVDSPNVILRSNDLQGPNGEIIPGSEIDLGIVTFMSRDRSDVYLNNIWIGGMPAAQGLNAPYSGFNQDAKDHLPALPVCIVKDDSEFENAKAGAHGYITLTDNDAVHTYFSQGQSKQFWITVHVPESIALTEIKTLFSGVLDLIIDGEVIFVPLEIEVINIRLDNLSDHNKFMGVMRVWDVGPDFRDTAMEDIRRHGCNALRAPIETLAEYDYVKNYGFKLVISNRIDWTAEDVQGIILKGFWPLMYGRDEPGKPPDPEATILEHINLTNRIQSVGGLAGTAGSYIILEEIALNRNVSQDWWLMGLSTRSWYSGDWLNQLTPTYQHIADVKENPLNKVAGFLEGIYEGTMNGHYPLLSRILYGFWFFHSKLDMGIHWGYAADAVNINPYSDTGAFMVAFPAEINSKNGSFLRREMIPSVTWESFREGIDDLKYALTINRMINQLPNNVLRSQLRIEFDDILRSFADIDVNDEHQIRIDAYNGYEGTRIAKERLIGVLVEILSEESSSDSEGGSGGNICFIDVINGNF